MVDGSTKLPRAEEMHRVQIGYIHATSVWARTLRPIFLDVHSKKTHICTIHLLKCEECLCSIRELFWQITRLHKPSQRTWYKLAKQF